MAKSRKEGRQARALARNPAYALQQAANKVRKGKARKQARKANRALQTALHHLHTPDAGRRSRKEARRWVQAQLEAKCITGHVAMELFVFLQEPTMGGKKKFTVGREDLSEEAEVVWTRWLEEVAGGEGEGRVEARNEVQADAILAEEGRGREGGGGLEVGDGDGGDDYRFMLNGNEVEADAFVAGEGGGLEAGDGDGGDDYRIMLSPEPLDLKDEEGALGVLEQSHRVVLCHRPRKIEEEEL